MLNLEELLAPIEGDDPAGPESRSTNEYALIERSYRAADEPVFVSPGEVMEEPAADFEEVIEPAQEFLTTRSKDLSVAAYLAASLLQVQGYSGLAEGLELIQGLLDRYWEGLHPGVESRAAILEWFGSDDVSYAISLVPLTEIDPRFRFPEYKEWAKAEAEGEGGTEAEEGEGDFGSAFGQTPREWYVELVTALRRCNTFLDAIVELGKEKFKEADVTPPRLKPMREALVKVTKAAEDLLSRKPGPPVPETSEVPESDDALEEGGEEEPSAPARGGLAEPTTPEEAANLVAAAGRFFRKTVPWHPASYLLLRGLRWGELRAEGGHIDPRILVAPTTSQRTRLKSLFLDQKFEELLHASEEIMGTPVGRGWLDLQRYTVLSAERLGKEYRQARNAVLKETARLLKDLPDLVEMTLMDDSATASRDTLAWMESEGLLAAGEEEGERPAEKAPVKDAQKIIQDASYDRAAAMARGGDPEGAIEILMERAEHESSQRGRFITKAEAAGIMVDHGMVPIARPILDELFRLIEEHRLEEWEPAEVVARPLGLLFSCMDEGETSTKEQLYPRLAKLDPLLAMEVSGKGRNRSRPAASLGSQPAQEESEAASGNEGEAEGEEGKDQE